MPVTKAMFAELRRAVTAVRNAEADLGRVQGSFGWNEQYEKVAVAERPMPRRCARSRKVATHADVQ